MSESPAALAEMTREELKSEVADLRERVQTNENDLAFIKRTLFNVLDGEPNEDGYHPLEGLPESGEKTRSEIQDLQSAVSHHGEQLEAVANVGQKKTNKEGKVAAIAAFAMQKADASQSKILVKSGEIRGCVGCSRRYSYDLIDSIGGLDDDGDGGDFEDGEYSWAAVREEMTVPTGTGTERKPKALKVDCDRLRESSHAPESVNKFTTRSDEEGR